MIVLDRKKMNETLQKEWAAEAHPNDLWHALNKCTTQLSSGIREIELLSEKGSALAAFYVGFIYTYGSFGAKVDQRRAYDWLTLSAGRGSLEAVFHLAKLLQKKGETESAINHYQKLTEHSFAPAFHALGCLYADQNSVLFSKRKALDFFASGARLGHLHCSHWLYFLTEDTHRGLVLRFRRAVGRLRLAMGLVYFEIFFANSNRVRV